MLWFIFAFLAAFFDSAKGVFSKKSVKNIDEYVVSWASRFFTLLFLSTAFLFIEIPEMGDRYLIALLIGGSINAVTTVLVIKALKYSDLSVVAPIATFTPLFLLITSPLITGEIPTIFGLLGVFLIVFGSYMLNIKKRGDGYIAPFKALLRERGALLMLVVAFLWSITSNIDKIGIQNSSPVFWAISVNAYVTLILFPVALFRLRKLKSPFASGKLFQGLKTLVPIGIVAALMLVCQMTAISMALVVYVISIKRISAVISVLFGYLIFKEKNIKERLIGSAIMIVGVLFITLLG
ncbi:EamA family transporter [Candidatus Parcubacteria bacterium]|nr:EamA family transporter [Candidatus Parcubacteria bacterium]